MQFVSQRKRFSRYGALEVFLGVVFLALGACRVGDDGPVMLWLRIFLGIFMGVSGTRKILNDTVQIVVNDRELRYRRRKGHDLVVPWIDVIDSEIGRTSIRFRYKGPLDIQSDSIPLRRFQEDDAEALWEIFSQKQIAQQAGGCDGERLRS